MTWKLHVPSSDEACQPLHARAANEALRISLARSAKVRAWHISIFFKWVDEPKSRFLFLSVMNFHGRPLKPKQVLTCFKMFEHVFKYSKVCWPLLSQLQWFALAPYIVLLSSRSHLWKGLVSSSHGFWKNERLSQCCLGLGGGRCFIHTAERCKRDLVLRENIYTASSSSWMFLALALYCALDEVSTLDMLLQITPVSCRCSYRLHHTSHHNKYFEASVIP